MTPRDKCNHACSCNAYLGGAEEGAVPYQPLSLSLSLYVRTPVDAGWVHTGTVHQNTYSQTKRPKTVLSPSPSTSKRILVDDR
jgi:hypothetical protein